MTDTIARARRDLELTDEALAHAKLSSAPAEVIEDLTVDAADAEAAYLDACSNWEPSILTGLVASVVNAEA